MRCFISRLTYAVVKVLLKLKALVKSLESSIVSTIWSLIQALDFSKVFLISQACSLINSGMKRGWSPMTQRCFTGHFSMPVPNWIYVTSPGTPFRIRAKGLPVEWRLADSNRWHPACKAGALPTELNPQTRMGHPGLEPGTSPLSGVRSNHLS